MSRLQLRKWTILLAALALVVSASSTAVLAQENEHPLGDGKAAAAENPGENVKPRPADDAAAQAAIRKELEMPTNMEFIETPLQEAVDYLKDLHQIEIQIDTKALEEQGVGSDTPVSGTLKRVSLESALELLWSKHDLTFVVDKGVLLITTPAAVANMVEIRVYDVSDLLEQGDAQQLTPILRLALDSPKAPKMGGPAVAPPPTITVSPAYQQVGQQAPPAMQVVPYVPGDAAMQGSVILSYGKLIVVRASIVEHEAIAELLENMRSAVPSRK